MKTCSKCNIEKIEKDFPFVKDVREYFMWCFDCCMSYNKRPPFIAFIKEVKKMRGEKNFHLFRGRPMSKDELSVRLDKYKKTAKDKVKTLHPTYVKAVLRQNGFDNELIKRNPEIVELKQSILKIKRLCKNSQKTSKN